MSMKRGTSDYASAMPAPQHRHPHHAASHRAVSPRPQQPYAPRTLSLSAASVASVAGHDAAAIVIRIPCRGQHGRIIGKQGAGLKTVRQETGANITVDTDADEVRAM